MTDGEVRGGGEGGGGGGGYGRDGEIATVIFDRAGARNAMTWRMYGSSARPARKSHEEGMRVAVFRGAGGRPFIAGTDIAHSRSSAVETMDRLRGEKEAILPESRAAVDDAGGDRGVCNRRRARDSGGVRSLACEPRLALGVPIARTSAIACRLPTMRGSSPRSWLRAQRMLLMAGTSPPRRRWRPVCLRDRAGGTLGPARRRCAPRRARMPPSPAREQGGDRPTPARGSYHRAMDLVCRVHGQRRSFASGRAFVENASRRWTGKGACGVSWGRRAQRPMSTGNSECAKRGPFGQGGVWPSQGARDSFRGSGTLWI